MAERRMGWGGGRGEYGDVYLSFCDRCDLLDRDPIYGAHPAPINLLPLIVPAGPRPLVWTEADGRRRRAIIHDDCLLGGELGERAPLRTKALHAPHRLPLCCARLKYLGRSVRGLHDVRTTKIRECVLSCPFALALRLRALRHGAGLIAFPFAARHMAASRNAQRI